MKKMTSYIIAGVKADDENVFMQRVGELLERNDLLAQLTEGVPVSAVVVDEVAVLDWLQKKSSERHNLEIPDNALSCGSDGRVQLRYKYTMTRWYKTQEQADKKGWDCENKEDAEHPFSAERPDSNSCDVNENTPGIKILYV